MGEHLRRMKGRLGKAEGITASAHKRARVAYGMIKNRQPYDEQKAFRPTASSRAKRLKRMQEEAACRNTPGWRPKDIPMLAPGFGASGRPNPFLFQGFSPAPCLVHPQGRRMRAPLPWVLRLASALLAVSAALASPPRFSRDILPILSNHCLPCHGPDAAHRKGGLRLDTAEGARAGGKSGLPAIVPGNPALSALVQRIHAADPDDLMPPASVHKPLADAQRQLLADWIRDGAPWGRHWAYEPVVRPFPPRTPRATLNPIDAFVRDRLARENLAPSPEAGRATLLRRVTLDLTGLPPSPDELASFLSDPRPDAYERTVDRLLASPRHGERMSWEWLEAARYADSNGYQGDGERTAWPWRDWVVHAFNRNLPFDQFTLWQLAGDLLPSPSQEQRLATAFVRNHPINGEGGRIPEENRIDYLFDQVETVGTAWLGQTFNCTRCHDHKFDPVSQADYFRLLALFNRTAVDGGGGNPQTPPVLEVIDEPLQLALDSASHSLRKAVAAMADAESKLFPRPDADPIDRSPAFKDLPKEVADALKVQPANRNSSQAGKLHAHFEKTAPDYAATIPPFQAAYDRHRSVQQSIPKVMVMEDAPSPRDTFILARGLYTKPGIKVGPGLPPGISPTPAAPASNRLDLARWLLRPDHPLTARVIANRQWQLFLGTGLVKTSEDFGLQGEPPSHPDLLDWLASELVASGWDIKNLQRLIVTSATYRQASQTTPQLSRADPENRLLARGPRHRMPSWMLRDVALAASGLLVEQLGGPPVKPYQPDGVWEEATFGNKKYQRDSGAPLYRRSLYVFWRRIIAPTLFFDVASRQTCTVRSPRTNTPLQALLLLNDTSFVEAARAMAASLCAHSTAPESRIEELYLRVLSRRPSPNETRLLLAAATRHASHFTAHPDAAARLLKAGDSPAPASIPAHELAAWTLVASTVLNLDEALSSE